MRKSSIDRLGDRLRADASTEADLRELTLYRQGFASAYSRVFAAVRDLGLEPTGRPAKSTSAIIEKLRRESIRLSQIQDIAGLRVIVADCEAQDLRVEQIRAMFEHTSIIDRRDRPSHGYRAVHVVVSIEGAPVEVQVRTEMQHRWAELSEKLSDVVDPSVKYGGGPPSVRAILGGMSAVIGRAEDLERQGEGMRHHAPSPAPSSPNAADSGPVAESPQGGIRTEVQRMLDMFMQLHPSAFEED